MALVTCLCGRVYDTEAALECPNPRCELDYLRARPYRSADLDFMTGRMPVEGQP